MRITKAFSRFLGLQFPFLAKRKKKLKTSRPPLQFFLEGGGAKFFRMRECELNRRVGESKFMAHSENENQAGNKLVLGSN